MAQLMKKDGILKTSCGSPHYASPEVGQHGGTLHATLRATIIAFSFEGCTC